MSEEFLDNIKWFKIPIIFPITSGFASKEDLSEIDIIKMKNEGLENQDVETDMGFYNLVNDPICQLNPKCFIPKGKFNKKYYTEIIFASGDKVYALGRPSSVYEAINKYTEMFPTEKQDA